MNIQVIIFLIGLIICKVCADYQEDVWQEPSAWERHSPSVLASNTCPVCEAVEDSAVAIIYYKKLIANLFNKNTLKQNEYTGQLERAILFSLSPGQLELIEKYGDIRNLDAVVTDILGAARTPANWADEAKESKGFLRLVWDILLDFYKISSLVLSNSESRFALFVVGVVMFIWFIHKRYNKNIVFVVAIVFVLFGYFFTYLECNRKLEADKMIAFSKESEPEEGSWLRKTFNSFFKKTEQDKLILNIQKQSKINLPFCRPDQVLMMYINEMFLNQFQLIIEKCVEMSMSFNDKIPFPYNIAAMITLPFLFMGIIKLVFKHVLSPVAWYKVLRTNNNTQQQTQQQEPQVDRLSGDNLKKFLEFMNHNRPNAENQVPPSGVQDIIEPPKAAALEEKSDESSVDDNFKSESNATSENSVKTENAFQGEDSVKSESNVKSENSVKNSDIAEEKVKKRKLKIFSLS